LVAQLVEHKAENLGVAGSSPVQNSISFNNKLFFKYILNNTSFSFINNNAQKSKNLNILITQNTLSYLMTHFRLSSVFYSSQLVDMFAYEVISSKSKTNNILTAKGSKSQSTIVVYNLHSMYNSDRFFIFLVNSGSNFSQTRYNTTSGLYSIAELFPAANWLEREVSELHGVNFFGKKDLRNLMLQYGDSTSPFQKSFPTIGLREMYYEPLKDTIIQNPISVQL
jgi:NADH:ubiquinone oxidoreductase subunit C